MSAQAKHTPGEWVVSSSILVCTKEGRIVAQCNPTGIGPLDVPMSEAAANATLIAAAPELLAALERTLSWLTSYQGGGTMGIDGPYEQARAAIAKATGAQP